MTNSKRFFQVATFSVLSAVLIAGPGAVTAMAVDSGDKPVLAGPKVERKGAPENRKFNGEKMRVGDAFHQVLRELNLTEEQKKQIQTITVNAQAERATWQKAHGEEMQALNKKMQAAREAKDRDQVKAVLTEIQALRVDAPKPGENIDQIRALLTPEQITILEAKLKERKGDAGNMMEMREKRAAAQKDSTERKGPRQDGEVRKNGEKRGTGAKNEETKTQDGELSL